MITKCDFCGSKQYEELYQPVGTKRNNRVLMCLDCGLVYSVHDDVSYSRKPTVSGDADWGNVRFCKSQRFDVVQGMLPIDAKHILDVGSSRGDFVRWAREQNPDAEITAVEPDTRVIGSYADEFNVIGQRLEDIELPDNHFDFVYCMQTLEHVDSAAAMLRQIYDALAPGGRLFLEVPNLAVIDYSHNIEEFFIDKHNFHFDRRSLINYLVNCGYSVRCNDDKLNVRISATKEETPKVYGPVIIPQIDARKLIADYAETIQRNRAKLPAVAEKINEMNRNMKLAFFGANTIFDLLVKYGGLDPQSVNLLVDDYLCNLVADVHGVTVQPADAFRVYQPDVCVILARHSADAVAARARKFGIRNIVKFYDLIRAA